MTADLLLRDPRALVLAEAGLEARDRIVADRALDAELALMAVQGQAELSRLFGED